MPSGLLRFASKAILVAIVSAGSASIGRAETTPRPFTSYPTSMREVLERYPSREANRPALELERIAASMGIDLVPRSRPDREGPLEEAKRAFEEAKLSLQDYLTSQFARSDAGIEAPPPTAGRFLRDRAEHLDALRGRLSFGSLPQWERDLSRLAEAPISNLLGHINLQRVLMADGLARAARGDDAGALADLEASWALNRTLRDEPTVITQLIAVAVVRMQAGLLRRLTVVSSEWSGRLGEHDYLRSLTGALWLEGWMWTQAGWSDRPTPRDFLPRVREWLMQPYFRLCRVDAAERWRRYLEELSAEASLCEADLDRHGERLTGSMPWWNRLAEPLVGNPVGALGRVARLELDLELTERILSRNATPRPPRRRLEPSRACPSFRWVYEVRDDGSISIALDGERTWPGQTGLILPTRYEETPTGP